jgi:hypothetical protein
VAWGQGWVAIVCTTLFFLVSITDTSLVAVLVTNSAWPLACSAVGCSPTTMLVGAWFGADRLIALTVPVVVAAVTWSAGTWVPSELIVGSPGLAGRPPSLLT